MELNRSDTAKKLNVSLTTLDDWRRKGCPSAKKGKQVFFDVDELKTWLDNRSSGDLNYTQERAKLTKLQAEKATLELEFSRGNLIPMELVVETWQGHIGNARAKLLGFPAKAAAQSIGMDDYLESEDFFTGLINEALDELSSAD